MVKALQIGKTTVSTAKQIIPYLATGVKRAGAALDKDAVRFANPLERADVLVRNFLAALFEGVDGYVNVRTLPPVEQGFFPIGDVDALEAFVKPRRDRNVYVGAASRRTDHDGSLAGCGALPALFADIDFRAETDEGEARRTLEAFALAPSIVVQSGGGLQPWWLLREPMDLQRDAPRAKSLLRRLAVSLDADLAAAEPARILRLPNTQNFKYQPARRVRVEVFEPDRRYNSSEFDEWLPTLPVPAAPTPANLSERVEEHRRNDTLYRLGRALKSKQLPAPIIASTIRVVNSEHCDPPLEASEVDQIVHNVLHQPDRPQAGVITVRVS